MTAQSRQADAVKAAPSTPPQKLSGDPAAKFREPQLRRLFRHRHRHEFPADDIGRRAAARMLDAIALSGGEGKQRAENFLTLWCPWMHPDERSEMINKALDAPWMWSAQMLGDDLGLTWEEREACRITTIRPAGATLDDLNQRKKEKAKLRMREARRKANLQPKNKTLLPCARASVIASILRPGERVAVSALCQHLKRTKPVHFAVFARDHGRLKAAVHDAIKAGVSLDLLKKDVEIGARGLPIAWISRRETAS